MKKRNKLTAAVLAAAMVGSMAMPALAVDATDTDTKTAKLTYTVNGGYEWSIHSDINIDENSTIKKPDNYGLNDYYSATEDITNKELEVSVSKCSIPYDKKLTIKIAGEGANVTSLDTTPGEFILTPNNTSNQNVGHYFVYSLADSSDPVGINPGDTILTVAAGGNPADKDNDVKLEFGIEFNNMFDFYEGNTNQFISQIADTYTGTVTYVAEVVSAT